MKVVAREQGRHQTRRAGEQPDLATSLHRRLGTSLCLRPRPAALVPNWTCALAPWLSGLCS